MSSITFALSTDDRPVPGIDALQAAVLFVMHAPPVRKWIRETREAAGNHGVIVIADDEWLNTGGYESLTVPASKLDTEALNSVREKLAGARKEAGDVPAE